MPTKAIPGVIFQPQTHLGMQRGVNQLVAVVRPTLGPCPRVVAVENTFRGKTPELLDNAGVITRRIIQLPDREADVGAMLLRHVLWRVHEDAGDGTATAAVLFEAVYNRGLHYIASGGDAMQLRRYLERGLQIILDQLDQLTTHLSGKAQLAQLAESLCFDQPLAALLGEIFDIIGEYGQVDIRASHGRTLERQYVEGLHWSSSVLSPHMFTDQGKLRADLTNVAILISDLDLEDPRQVMHVLDTATEQQVSTLLLIANKLSESVIALLLAASREPEQFRVVAVRTPGLGTLEQAEAMQDLAILTGGRPLLQAAGDSIRSFKSEHLGYARRAWADRSTLGIIGGKGNARALRIHIAKLRGALAATTEPTARKRLQTRLGKFLGGSATLTVGGSTESELTARVELARKTASLLRAAISEGVVVGGGVTLLACRQQLRDALEASTILDEQVAYRILIRALEEPLRTIASNAGYEASAIVGQVERAAAGYGFDARSGQIVDMAQAGIYDAAAAQKAALRGAISGAATALTVDTVVHTSNPVSAAGHP